MRVSSTISDAMTQQCSLATSYRTVVLKDGTYAATALMGLDCSEANLLLMSGVQRVLTRAALDYLDVTPRP